MRGDFGPERFTDQLWRALLTILVTIGGLYIAWTLARQLLGPMLVVAALLGVLRLAMGGYRSRRGW